MKRNRVTAFLLVLMAVSTQLSAQRVTVYTTTDGQPWVESKTTLQAKATGEVVAYAGRDYERTPVVVFRSGSRFIVTAGNFTDAAATMSVALSGKYLTITTQPHSFNTNIIGK